ncbi:hypothetical protein [Daejeonella sp.]|uniref:hypothetical protein n=1 Tax=Daejeonella sp. TaxID=2805397 RepID=UPI0030BB8BDC
MKLNHLFYITSIIFLTFNGCGPSEKEITADTGVRIALSADSSGVELQQIPSYAIKEFLTDSLKTEQWQDFFAVYEEPSDKEMRDFQAALGGSYTIKDRFVSFVPSGGFKKGTSYFSRCYTRELLQEPEDLIATRDLSPTDGFLEYKFNIK